MKGRVCLITGASGGIGLATARALGRRGAVLRVVGRDAGKLERAAAEVGAIAYRADFSSLEQVRALADEVLARDEPLHVLINNAGVWHPNLELSADGFEDTFAVNHLAPFLLTCLLVPRMRESEGDRRVVHVSSRLHLHAGQPTRPHGVVVNLLNVVGIEAGGRSASLDFDAIDRRESYRGLEAYARSKLAQILFSNELARREKDVTSNALHPGSVASDVQRDSALLSFLAPLARPLLKTTEQGARTSVYVATEPSLSRVSGRYFANSREAEPASVVHDRGVAERLWELSAERVGL